MGKSKKPRRDIVTIVGSARYKYFILEAQKSFTLSEHIVLTPGYYPQQDGIDDCGVYVRMHGLCRKQIDLSGWVYVVNPELYFGVSTWSAISYAWMTGKGVSFMEGGDFIQKQLPKIVKGRIKTAKAQAHDNLELQQDLISHATKAIMFPSFEFHGATIIDPWLTPEANDVKADIDRSKPLPKMFKVKDPFKFYGLRRVARFIEHLLTYTMREQMEEQSYDFYQEVFAAVPFVPRAELTTRKALGGAFGVYLD